MGTTYKNRINNDNKINTESLLKILRYEDTRSPIQKSGNKSPVAIIPLILSLLLFLMLCILSPALKVTAQGTVKEDRKLNISVRVNFGVQGPKPLIWDGEARINEGKIFVIRGIGFDEYDSLFPEKYQWKCSIERLRGREYAQGLKSGVSVKEFMEELMGKGIELDIQATKDSTLTISTSAGNFSFPLSDLELGRKINFLNGNLTVELIPRPHQISKKGEIQNYPAIVSDNKGDVWLAWVSFSKGKETLMVSKFDGIKWTKPLVIDAGEEGYLTPALSSDSDGNIWIVWPAKVKGDWDLYAREYNTLKDRWSSRVNLTKNQGPDVHPVMAVDNLDRIYLCWQGIRNKSGEILLRVYDSKGNKGWGKALRVSNNPGNDWEPDIALNNQGDLLIVWEAYKDGLHRIMARRFFGGEFFEERSLISSKNYVAHASASADGKGRFWVAWDEAGEDWGFGEEEEDRTISINKFDEVKTQIDYDKVAIVGRRGRYNSRSLNLVCIEGDKLYKPAHDLLESLSDPMKIYADLPKIITDAQGRLWIIFHHYVGKIPFYVHGQLMELWKVYATYYDGFRWSEAIPMPHNTWRQLAAASVCIDKRGHMWTAYPQDGRETGMRETNPATLSVSSLALPAGDRISLPVTLYNTGAIQETGYGKTVKNAKEPKYITDIGTPRYTLYWGSMHDLHDVRGRMNLDGFVIDSFKYAMDDWGYDFLGLKDYVYRFEDWFTDDNYSWWETQKAIDLFTINENFLSFFLKGKSPYLRTPGHSLLKKRPPKGMPLIMGVYANEFSREALADAIEKRRQYLATDKILLDFWVAGHPMGDKFKSADRFPKMKGKVIGTSRLKRVDILRNAECIYSTEPNGNETQFTFIDMGLNPDVSGEYHYFLQALQEDGRMAWSPPACLHYIPGYDN